ncbi:hypothetical protein DL546_007252 [Coniochaeta pulveracea]|uniref:Uncharacterized protein n=1 Tax=Coniochaeta pulveracea TaxID=177199 RepID=A0A420YAY6_9PEZI|nr:hypothetical protein DL546_007252 [Coniochaeta pulveracea]
MSATRAFTLRSALRAATRTQIPRSTGRKGYASVRDAAQDAAQSAQKAAHGAQQAAHGAFQKSSDLPWALTAGIIAVSGSAYLISSRPAKMDFSHEEHKEYASKEHGVEEEKPESAINKDEEGVPRGLTPEPTSGGQTGDDETKGPMSDKKDVSIPKAVEEDSNKPGEQVDSEKGTSDGEGKEGPQVTDGGGQKEEGKSKESTGGTDKKKGSRSTEMDDDHESQAKKLSEKEPSKRVDPTKKSE